MTLMAEERPPATCVAAATEGDHRSKIGIHGRLKSMNDIPLESTRHTQRKKSWLLSCGLTWTLASYEVITEGSSIRSKQSIARGRVDNSS